MRDLCLFTLTALIVVVKCETIHFTNSPSHLIGAKNVTSYKLLVKNSDPITIIEANKEVDDRAHNTKYAHSHHANDRIDMNVDEGGGGGGDMPMHEYDANMLANLGGSHQIRKNTQNVRASVGFTVSGGPSDMAETNSDDFERRKTDQDSDLGNANAKKVVYSPILLKKFMQEYSEKLKNADNSVKSEIQKIHEKISEQQTDGHKGEVLEFDKSIEDAEQKFNLNGYRDMYYDDRRKRPSNPNKDNDGWVTLEAVPWSSSTVSKWHPHTNNDDQRRRPVPRPYYNKPDKYSYHHDDNDDDYYHRPKPGHVDRDTRPSVSVYSTWTKPQPLSSDERPRPKPYKFSGETDSFNSHKYSDSDRDRDRDRYSMGRPWTINGDIITDNRPSSFPSDSHIKYHDDIDRYQSASTSNFHSSYQNRPSDSNGEWVLISTTKGYQFPNRRQQGKRGLFQSNTKSSVTVVNVPQSMRMHKALKLTVLPALDTAINSTFSTDLKRKPTTTTIHGGMLEIDATHESIDDDVRKTRLAQKKFTTTRPVQVTPTELKNRKLLKGNFNIEEKAA